MFKHTSFKNILKGGEEKMKLLSILLVGAMILVVPVAAKADITLTVSAQITSGTSLAQHTLIACNGYNYNTAGDPWTQPACYSKTAGATSMVFGGKNGVGPLTTRLYDTSGNDIGGAGCFYGANFFIVYLFPDAWGGKGYELKQNAGAFSLQIANSVVRTPVYSPDDKYSGATSGQGDLTPEEETNNPQLTPNVSALAKNAGLILKSKQPRIVRAEYGIPPFPKTGDTRPTGWSAVLPSVPSGTYTGSVVLTMTEWL
jgi:hypothetical protein